MSYVILYFLFGVFVSLGLTQIDKLDPDDSSLTNRDRIIFILIWPIILIEFIRGLVKELY